MNFVYVITDSAAFQGLASKVKISIFEHGIHITSDAFRYGILWIHNTNIANSVFTIKDLFKSKKKGLLKLLIFDQPDISFKWLED